jgi:hypothetical protein
LYDLYADLGPPFSFFAVTREDGKFGMDDESCGRKMHGPSLRPLQSSKKRTPMKRLCVLMIGVWLGVGTGSAHAQFPWNLNPFRRTAPPPPPAERVSQLLATIKNEVDERKRTLAVEEIRDFDTRQYPEIVSVLADIAQNDPKAGVRAEAVSSLVRIRPVTSTAGQAIAYAAEKDESFRNRVSAQTALVRYRLAGYSSAAAARNDAKPPAQGPGLPSQSQEPPLADRPPVIYHDQTGKVIPPPKNAPGNVAPVANPIIGTPVSNPPGSKLKLPFFSMGSSNPPPSSPAPAMPPQSKGPAPVEPVFRNLDKLPPNPEPGPLLLAPVPSAPPVPSSPPLPVITPLPLITPAVPAISPSAPSVIGPSLDLPPQPINRAPAPSPAPPSPSGPTLGDPSTSAAPMPSGRMEPRPRLVPVVASGVTP